MYLFGAFVPVPPLPTIAPNSDTNWFMVTPGTAGTYRVKLALINSDRCVNVKEIDVVVGP